MDEAREKCMLCLVADLHWSRCSVVWQDLRDLAAWAA